MKQVAPIVYVETRTKTVNDKTKTYEYWLASWRENGKTRNVYLGSTGKMTREEATAKATALKLGSGYVAATYMPHISQDMVDAAVRKYLDRRPQTGKEKDDETIN
jgi:hypothetical protein